VEQKRIGRLQIEIGLVIIIISFILGIVGYYVIYSKVMGNLDGLFAVWNSDNSNIPKESIALISSFAGTISFMGTISLLILGVSIIILLSISMLLITQGSANFNLAKEKKAQLSEMEIKTKMKKVLIISSFLIFLGSLLYFSPFFDFSISEKPMLFFGFPSEYIYYSENQFWSFSFISLGINLFFSVAIGGIFSLIHYRYVSKPLNSR